MVKSRRDIALNASRASSRAARMRRFQRVVQEMRDEGMVVIVREEAGGAFRDVPQLSIEATFDAVHRSVIRVR